MIIEDGKTDASQVPRPTEIVLHQASNILELAFEHDSAAQNPPRIRLSAEYLRINSPSAEVQGHGPGERVLVAGKLNVGISGIHPVGNYAILLLCNYHTCYPIYISARQQQTHQ